ncbi:hypothetical protein GCM10009119_41840 [Algoriphagus jejuensis]|uniref:FUSC family protein n=1 Tax=Algoriphagus jejuensis TaxID=419934 RepID=A0ABP3YL16_9BACT
MEYKELTDQELLEEQKKLNSFSILNAFLIGFLVGIVLFSIYYHAYGIALLIPLFLIYKLTNDPRNKRVKELEMELKVRKLR